MAVTPATLLKVVVPGILIKEEQKGLAEALFALSARRTLSLLQAILLTIVGSGFLPRIRTSPAKVDAGKKTWSKEKLKCISVGASKIRQQVTGRKNKTIADFRTTDTLL